MWPTDMRFSNDAIAASIAGAESSGTFERYRIAIVPRSAVDTVCFILIHYLLKYVGKEVHWFPEQAVPKKS